MTPLKFPWDGSLHWWILETFNFETHTYMFTINCIYIYIPRYIHMYFSILCTNFPRFLDESYPGWIMFEFCDISGTASQILSDSQSMSNIFLLWMYFMMFFLWVFTICFFLEDDWTWWSAVTKNLRDVGLHGWRSLSPHVIHEGQQTPSITWI